MDSEIPRENEGQQRPRKYSKGSITGHAIQKLRNDKIHLSVYIVFAPALVMHFLKYYTYWHAFFSRLYVKLFIRQHNVTVL